MGIDLEYVISDIEIIRRFKEKFGKDISLSEIIEEMKEGRQHKCPKCDGKGHYLYRRGYTRWVQCDVCDGIGYTKEKLVPKMKQVDWKK